jgi:hypothetical protein
MEKPEPWLLVVVTVECGCRSRLIRLNETVVAWLDYVKKMGAAGVALAAK